MLKRKLASNQLPSAPINSRLNVAVRFSTQFWLGSKWLLAFPRVPVTQGTPLESFFLPCCPLNDRRRAAHSFCKIGRLSYPFSCLFYTRLRLPIFLLFLMSCNIRPNPGPIFSCPVCTGNVTWRSKSVQCCTCSKWVHLKCSLLSLSKFRTLDSSHSWSCPHYCALACNTVTSIVTLHCNTVTSSSDSSGLYTSTVQSGLSMLMHHSRPTLALKPLIPLLPILFLLPLLPHHCPLPLAFLQRLLLPLPP